jgi:hypothetical protein
LMSLQPLYYIVGGDPGLYGLCLGIYDLSFIVCAPFCALFLSRTNQYMTVFVASMILSMIGNVLYSMVVYFCFSTTLSSNAWIFLFISRAIMGAGSVNIIAGSTYITNHIKFDDRMGAMGTYQNFQVVSRLVGPMIGFLFLALPFPTATSSGVIQVFNFYTMNGWLMAIVSLFGLFGVFWYFSPSNMPKLEGDRMEGKYFDAWNAPKGRNTLFQKILINSVLVIIFGFVDYSILGQLFAFGTSQFHVVATQYDLWQPFVGVGAGALAAAIVWRRIAKRWDHPAQETIWCMIGLALGFGVPFFFVNYGGVYSTTSPPALLYIGTTLIGLSQTLSFSNLEVIFSKQLTQHLDEVANSIGTMFSLYGISQSFARFLGPFVTGFIIPIHDSATNSNPCYDATGQFNASSTCCFTPSGFTTTTCELLNVDIWLPILVVISSFATALGFYFTCVTVDYGRADAKQKSFKSMSGRKEIEEDPKEFDETDSLLAKQ